MLLRRSPVWLSMRVVMGVVLLFNIVLLGACQNTRQSTTPDAVEREWQYPLSQRYAAFRSHTVSDVHYDLDIDLTQSETQFYARSTVSFNWHDKSQSELTLDFEQGDIQQVKINGKIVAADYEQWYLRIAAEALTPGRNVIEVLYRRAYSTDGMGLHHFKDRDSGRRYLYSQFEAYEANKVFPLFDQPDIKATYTLTVQAPLQWQVITSVREAIVEKGERSARWYFPESARFSPYVFSLHAGPYAVWESNRGSIPLRLFARQEMQDYVNPDQWFDATYKSLAFFERYFELPYPFLKYDQIIVPEFNFGAMENVAAVTFTEKLLTRSEPTEAQRRRVANIIAHEAAHMWFGNIVTMQWWDDLWLNESFATYMANLALVQSAQFDGVWEAFYAGTKQRAYRADEAVTTHPVYMDVPSTGTVLSTLDGITYGKGASVLKQLPYYVDETQFQKGVALYLKTHAWGNAQLQDFVSSLEAASQKNLQAWSQSWLLEPGVNTIEVHFECRDEQLSKLELIQYPDRRYPTLRTQRVQLALYRFVSEGASNEPRLAPDRVLPVTYSGERTVVLTEQGIACPEFIYPNYGDWGYVKVKLDPKSMATLEGNINAFEHEAMHLALWQSLWDAVRDARLPLNYFTDFAFDHLGAESSVSVASFVTTKLVRSATLFWHFEFEMKRPGSYLRAREEIEQFLLAQFETAPPESDLKRNYLDAAIKVAHSNEGLAAIAQLLDRDASEVGLKIDQDVRWRILTQLNRFQFEAADKRIEEEAERDRSERADKGYATAIAAAPELPVKQQWFDTLISTSATQNFSTQRSVMSHLFPPEQLGLLATFQAEWAAALPALQEDSADLKLQQFGRYITPVLCDTESNQFVENVLNDNQIYRPSFLKSVKLALQESERCVRQARTQAEADASASAIN